MLFDDQMIFLWCNCNFRLRIPEKYCDRYCVPTYKRYLKASVIMAKEQLTRAFNAYNKRRMNFHAARRNFEAEGASASDLIVECNPGMRSKNSQCSKSFFMVMQNFQWSCIFFTQKRKHFCRKYLFSNVPHFIGKGMLVSSYKN